MPGKKTKKLSGKEINKYIDGIYEGSINKNNLSEEVYFAITSYLKDGLYKGFGMTLETAYDTPDLELLTELRENVYMFGAAKNYQMTKEISSLLVGPDGKLTLREFQEVAKKTYTNWNDNWGETEYSTAHGQAYQAQKWQNIIRQEDSLPNLRYSAIGDVCPICLPFDGIIAPIGDKIWNKIMPLNHFNCKCLVVQEDKFAKLSGDSQKEFALANAKEKMDKLFMGNVGKDGTVFNKYHPYFDVAKEDRDLAKKNFNMPIPKKDD